MIYHTVGVDVDVATQRRNIRYNRDSYAMYKIA